MWTLANAVLDDGSKVVEDNFETGTADQGVLCLLTAQELFKRRQHNLAQIQIPDFLVLVEHAEQVGQYVDLVEVDSVLKAGFDTLLCKELLRRENLEWN